MKNQFGKLKYIKSIGILGYGNFGSFIKLLLSKEIPQIKIKIFDPNFPKQSNSTFKEVVNSDIFIPAVPINQFEEVIKQVSETITEKTILFEVCSVQMYPKEILAKYLPKDIPVILSHPMFGPESYKKNNESVENFNMVVENITVDTEIFKAVKSFLSECLELNVIELSAEEHDKDASSFHFVTMFEAIFLKRMNLERSNIETESAKSMHAFVDRVGDDLGILADMYKYNPYCKEKTELLKSRFGELIGEVVET